MSGKRKSLSKKIRFEVFKRDSFACQYCGQKAPDVILEIDHISPVSKGGGNNIMNLVTSCKDCNSGKGARELSDNQVIEKQRQQLEDLNERRQQLDMMLQWQTEMLSLRDLEVDKLAELFTSRTGGGLTEKGRQDLAKSIKRFGFQEVMTSMDISLDQYLQSSDGANGLDYTDESVNKAFNYIGKIAACRQREADNPEWKEIYYIRGILRNRLSYINQQQAVDLIKQAIHSGVDSEDVKNVARYCRSWADFKDSIHELTGD